MNSVDYQGEIKKFLKNNTVHYVPLSKESEIKVYDLFINNFIYNLDATDVEIHYLGMYFQIKENDIKFKKCMKIAIKKGFSWSMRSLALYYEKNKNVEKAKKYYLMAIEHDNVLAMHDLGYYYQYTEINVKQMEKYYLMAIDKGHGKSMDDLGYYYQYTEINVEEMKKYYLMGVENGCNDSMFNLGYYYQSIGNDVEMGKYYLMAIDKGCYASMNNLGNYYFKLNNYDIAKIYFKMAEHDCNAIGNLGVIYENEGNTEEMLKCYLKALEKGHETIMYNLGNYYYYKDDEVNMIKYLSMGIEKNNKACFDRLHDYYYDNYKHIEILKLYIAFYKNDRSKIINKFNKTSQLLEIDEVEFITLISSFQFEPEDKLCIALKLLINTLKQKIDLMDLHFKYSPDGVGFNEAKSDFLVQCATY